jgi:hypothetical protein
MTSQVFEHISITHAWHDLQVQSLAHAGQIGVHTAAGIQGTTQQACSAWQSSAAKRAALAAAGTSVSHHCTQKALLSVGIHSSAAANLFIVAAVATGSPSHVSTVHVLLPVLRSQLKLCAGHNKLSQTLLPACNPDSLSLLEVPAEADSTTSSTSTSSGPNSIIWQFGLLLLNATHVGPTGFGAAVQPVRHVARCCIFDRLNNRFLGNVHTIPAAEAKPHRGLGSLGSFWAWDSAGPQAEPGPAADGTLSDLSTQQEPRLDPVPPGQLVGSTSSPGGVGASVAAVGDALVAAVGSTLSDDSTGSLGGANACVVRCAEMAGDPVAGVHKLDGERLSLYVELNVAFRLMAEDADAVPQDEAKVSLTGRSDSQMISMTLPSQLSSIIDCHPKLPLTATSRLLQLLI